jgi:hypothetical protein
VCAVSKALSSVSDGHYTEFGNCSVFSEEKGTRTLITRISHLKKRETHFYYACLASQQRETHAMGARRPFS